MALRCVVAVDPRNGLGMPKNVSAGAGVSVDVDMSGYGGYGRRAYFDLSLAESGRASQAARRRRL
jgi:hypothetical protein